MRYALRNASFCAIAIASVGFMAPPSSADPDKGRPHSDRQIERTDRGTDKGAKFEHSTRHVNRDRQFDRGGAQVELRGRDWRRPGYRERIRRGHHYGWGSGIGFHFSDGWYYGECGWLKRRAIETDSPIWWHRYRRCREFG